MDAALTVCYPSAFQSVSESGFILDQPIRTTAQAEKPLIRLLVVFLVALAALWTLWQLAISVSQALTYFDITAGNGDMGLFAELSRLQATGGRLYADLWDNKPPGMFFFISPFVSVFGNTPLAIGASLVGMVTLFIVSVSAMVWQVTTSRTALIAGALLAAFYAATQQLLETTFLAAALSAGAVALAVAARGRVRYLFLAGVFFAAAAFTKQPAAFEFPIIAAFALWRTSPGPRAKLTTCVSLVAGALAIVALVVLWALSNAALDALWFHVVTSGARYVAASDGGWHFRREAIGLISYFAPITFRYLLVLLVPGMVSLVLLSRHARRQPAVWITVGWVLITFVTASVARGFRTVYYIQMLPALILCVSLGVPYVRRWSMQWQAAIVAVTVVIGVATFPAARKAVGWEIEDLSNEQPVVAYIDANTEPTDCLWLWGNLNFFSYLSERRSCTSAAFDGHVMDETAHPIEVNRIQQIHELIHRTPALYIEFSPWGHFDQLEKYASRYQGDRVLFSDPYTVYAVDRGMWHETDANFSNEIRLIGYDLLPVDSPVCAGDALTLAMTWEQISTPAHQYQMFAQLLTPDETARIAGYDGPPEDDDDDNATNTWVDTGEIRLGERFDMPIDADAAPGSYKLVVGLYDVETAERVPVLDASGAPVGSYAVLQEVMVSPACPSPE